MEMALLGAWDMKKGFAPWYGNKNLEKVLNN